MLHQADLVLMLAEIAAIGGILALGVAVQSAVGFGMGLMCVPLLVWSGESLPHAVAIVLGGGSIQVATGVWHVRREIRWGEGLTVAVFQWVGVIGGVAAMQWFVSIGPDAIKQGVGAAVLLILFLQLVVRPTPRDHLHRLWMPVAGGSAGFLAGSVGIGGPPLVFYALAHTWGRDRFRAFLWTQFSLAIPVLVCVLAYRFGVDVLFKCATGVLLAPLLWFATRAGIQATSHWSKERLRILVYAMLSAIGVVSIVGPLLE